ncbi:hypothetical protein AB0J21_09215 [Streptomyces sp. NPDC049954]|uniref:hypothetical protein n=1 Tax=Streptomyces sp. NPDC049954 TaxID=3155779 RepID=UPI003448AF5C
MTAYTNEHVPGEQYEEQPGRGVGRERPAYGENERHNGRGAGEHERFVAGDVRQQLGQRLQQALNEFVDSPRAAVEEADRILEDAVARLTEALSHRRGDLRASWDGSAAPGSAGTDSVAPGSAVPGSGPAAGRDGAAGAKGGGLRDGLGARDRHHDGDTATMAPVTDGPGATGTSPAPGGSARRTPAEGATGGPGVAGGASDTERLRLALREYRETTERLLGL